MLRVVLSFVWLLFFSLPSFGQTEVKKVKVIVVDEETQADVRKLIRDSGMLARWEALVPAEVERNKALFNQILPGVDPAFADEWTRRFSENLIQSYMAAAFKVFATYKQDGRFTHDDLVELTEFERNAREGRALSPSDAFRQKLAEVLPNLQRDLADALSGASLGLNSGLVTDLTRENPRWAAEVDRISKEHPLPSQ